MEWIPDLLKFLEDPKSHLATATITLGVFYRLFYMPLNERCNRQEARIGRVMDAYEEAIKRVQGK